MISKWCDIIREIGGMIPITPEIYKLCGHMQDWSSSMPKYYSKDFIISSETLNPECIIRGNRKSKQVRREMPVSENFYSHKECITCEDTDWFENLAKLREKKSDINEDLMDPENEYDYLHE